MQRNFQVMLLTFLGICLCAEMKYTEYGVYNYQIPEDVAAVVDIYGQGSDGFTNGTGGGSGAFVRTIIYGNLEISINQTGIYLVNEDTSIFVGSGQGMFGGTYQIMGDYVTAQNGNSGENKECVNGRCNISPCLKGCQGRQLNQQIVPGSGGLVPHYISLDGTIIDNPEYKLDDRYIIYTTNLLNCCGSDSVKCATECVNGVNGSNGNGGSGSVNTDGGYCDGNYYDATHCIPGTGGNPLVFISYETDEEYTESDINVFEFVVIISAVILSMVIILLCIVFLINKCFRQNISIQQVEV